MRRGSSIELDGAVLTSDLLGFIAALLLLIPPVKDQAYRFKAAQQERKDKRSPWPGLRNIIAQAWRRKRDSYDGWDSAFMFFGFLGLAASFFVKLY